MTTTDYPLGGGGYCHGIHPRSPDTDWNQACTAGRSTTLIPILISPDDYLVAERIYTSI
jgi:hypothetical protein